MDMVPVASAAIFLVALAFGIFGVGPNLREVGWAVEDSIVWVAERVPVALLAGALCAVLFATLTLIIARIVVP